MNTYFHTKFAQDLAGLNGKGAHSIAKQTVNFVENAFYTDNIIFEGDGAMKWKSNGRYIPQDCAEAVAFIRNDNKTTPAQRRCILNASVEATNEKRIAQEEESTGRYIMHSNETLSEEELYEMRSAFGEGTTVVNVLTGQRFAL